MGLLGQLVPTAGTPHAPPPSNTQTFCHTRSHVAGCCSSDTEISPPKKPQVLHGDRRHEEKPSLPITPGPFDSLLLVKWQRWQRRRLLPTTLLVHLSPGLHTAGRGQKHMVPVSTAHKAGL